VIVVGDLNASHRPIDHCDPYELGCFYNHPARVFLERLLVPISHLDVTSAPSVNATKNTEQNKASEATSVAADDVIEVVLAFGC
jgi:hypothetical protein